jgi:hypothetical protein
MALLAVTALAGCAEEEKPIDVPEHVQKGVLALLTAVDPDTKATFSGETCNTDRLADPPDDHRWRLEASFDGSADDVLAAGTKLGWQPERAEDGTLVLVNYHEFGETVDVAVTDGTARMMVEKDCTSYRRSEMDLPSTTVPETTGDQGERLGEMLDEVEDTLADITRDLRLRPKEGRYVAEEGPRTYSGCAADDRSGARWRQYDVLLQEATSDDDLGPVADRLVDAVPGWDVVKREEGVDSRGFPEADLELRSPTSRTTFTVHLSFWGNADPSEGVRFHITSGITPCVAVDAG